jgi:cell wall-associated NlpC family hydrolase
MTYEDLIGLPFKMGGRGPKYWDCYGIFMEINRRLGVDVPDLEEIALNNTEAINKNIEKYLFWFEPVAIDDLEPGDGLVFRTMGDLKGHIGVYVGENKFLHVSEKSNQVHTIRIDHPWYRQNIDSCRRFRR